MRKRTFFIVTVTTVGLFAAATSALADTVDLSSLNLVGTSQIISGGTLRLTPNYDTNPGGAAPAGAAWTTNQYDVADPFSVNFQFQMSNPCLTGLPTCVNDNGNGGDGIAFLIQNSSAGDTAIGEGAGGMGFLGIQDSVAVMLDTYQNASPDYYGDPSNNYISVNTRGTDFNVPHHFCTYVPADGQMELTADPTLPSDLTGSSFSPLCTANPTLGMTGYGGVPALIPNMDDGQVHDLGITYNGTALDIYLDSTLVLAVSIDLATTLNLQAGDDAFLGFTAGTRFAYQDQDILSLNISTPEPSYGQFWVPLAMFVAAGLTRRWRRARS